MERDLARRRRRADGRPPTCGWGHATGRGASVRSASAEPAGRNADEPNEGFWWLYVPLRFDDFAIIVICQERPDGFRTLNDATRVWRDGRVEQLGWPEVDITYRSGTRHPEHATLAPSRRRGQAAGDRGRHAGLRGPAHRRRVRRRPGLVARHSGRAATGRKARCTTSPTPTSPDASRSASIDHVARATLRRGRGLGPVRARVGRPPRPHRLLRLGCGCAVAAGG